MLPCIYHQLKTSSTCLARLCVVIKNLFWLKSSDIKSQTYTTGRNAPEMHVYTWYIIDCIKNCVKHITAEHLQFHWNILSAGGGQSTHLNETHCYFWHACWSGTNVFAIRVWFTFRSQSCAFWISFCSAGNFVKSMTINLSIVLSNLHSRSHKYRITIYTISFEKLTKILKYLCSLTLVSNIRPFVLQSHFHRLQKVLQQARWCRWDISCFLLVFTTINKGVWCIRFAWRFFEIQNNLEPVRKD